MRAKPKRLDALALFLLGVTVAMPLQIMIMYGNMPIEIGAILAKLAPLNWMILGLAPLTAWFIHRASPLVIVSAPILILLVIRNNWLVAEIGNDFSPWLIGMSTGAFVLAMGTLTTRETRDLLLNPGHRWWLTPRRKRTIVPVHVVVPGLGEYSFDSQTFDISETGAFIIGVERASQAHEGQVLAGLLRKIAIGTDCSVSIELNRVENTLTSIKCRAEIVRASEAYGQYPSGIGVRFIGLGREERRLLSEYINAA